MPTPYHKGGRGIACPQCARIYQIKRGVGRNPAFGRPSLVPIPNRLW